MMPISLNELKEKIDKVFELDEILYKVSRNSKRLIIELSTDNSEHFMQDGYHFTLNDDISKLVIGLLEKEYSTLLDEMEQFNFSTDKLKCNGMIVRL